MKILLALAMIVCFPLLGAVVAGQPVQPYLDFPPRTRVIPTAPFSWQMFFAVALLIALTVGPVVLRVLSSPIPSRDQAAVRSFPWWGWVGVALAAGSWVLAWNRFSWFATLQAHTFTPLWLGYILAVNGWTFRRTGRSMMLDHPKVYVALFPASAMFWWTFEYLNRFVNNWYYVGPHAFTPWEYFFHATIPFSTVLPAVLGTMELLASVPRFRTGLDALPAACWPSQQWAGWSLLLLSCAALAGIGARPSWFFPFVWLAPLLLITALQILAGEETIFSCLIEGDGTSLWLAAVAALVCGLCWEMWNYKSLAHWEYAIPSLHGFKLFEMPLLGYAGYLPFGLECLAVALLLFPKQYREIVAAMLARGRDNDRVRQTVKGV